MKGKEKTILFNRDSFLIPPCALSHDLYQIIRRKIKMEKSELKELKEQLEAKGIKWEEAAEKIKFDTRLLNLYLASPPVPISVINPLKKLLAEA
jgi:hypothetical protein